MLISHFIVLIPITIFLLLLGIKLSERLHRIIFLALTFLFSLVLAAATFDLTYLASSSHNSTTVIHYINQTYIMHDPNSNPPWEEHEMWEWVVGNTTTSETNFLGVLSYNGDFLFAYLYFGLAIIAIMLLFFNIIGWFIPAMTGKEDKEEHTD